MLPNSSLVTLPAIWPKIIAIASKTMSLDLSKFKRNYYLSSTLHQTICIIKAQLTTKNQVGYHKGSTT